MKGMKNTKFSWCLLKVVLLPSVFTGCDDMVASGKKIEKVVKEIDVEERPAKEEPAKEEPIEKDFEYLSKTIPHKYELKEKDRWLDIHDGEYEGKKFISFRAVAIKPLLSACVSLPAGLLPNDCKCFISTIVTDVGKDENVDACAEEHNLGCISTEDDELLTGKWKPANVCVDNEKALLLVVSKVAAAYDKWGDDPPQEEEDQEKVSADDLCVRIEESAGLKAWRNASFNSHLMKESAKITAESLRDPAYNVKNVQHRFSSALLCRAMAVRTFAVVDDTGSTMLYKSCKTKYDFSPLDEKWDELVEEIECEHKSIDEMKVERAASVKPGMVDRAKGWLRRKLR